MSNHGRTVRILAAIEDGVVTPPAIGRRIDVPTQAVRDSLFRLRKSGRVTRTEDGEWKTLPSTNPAQILEVLSTIETGDRRWTASEIAICTDMSLGQIIAITDTLARSGYIERVSTGAFRKVEPQELDRY
jgi:DNA-binding IclR family transcriptional regulator